MLRLITGLPGHNKTSNTLALFLEQKGKRPLYATHINGFDYDKHGVGKLEHLSEIFDLPPGSLIFCDEAQQFLRPRGKSDKLPEWVALFETHRHKGIDLWYTTQHPMQIDVHVRRLTDEHHHYFRPKGMQRLTTRREWDGVQDDPNDYHAKQLAEVKSAVPPAYIFKEYESTQEDTTKARFPRKLIYAAVALLLAVVFIVYKGASLYQSMSSKGEVSHAESANAGLSSSMSTSSIVPDQQPGRQLTLADFRPVSELAPWTAPVYSSSVKIQAVPRFAGCMATKKGCHCMTQQGSYLEVQADTCYKVVYGRAMPFNPFKPDSPDYVPSQVPAAAAPAQGEEEKVLIVESGYTPKELPEYKSIYAK